MELLRRICDFPVWPPPDNVATVIGQFWAGLMPPETFKALMISESSRWMPLAECIVQQW